MARLWLHIGAPKSGTTALQRYLSANRVALLEAGMAYVAPGSRTSSNKIAVAINKKRHDELAALSRDVADQLGAASTDCLISSEMFFGMAPDILATAIPALAPSSTEILIYLRRQDRYIESKYVQKLKNGRFSGSIHDFIEKFGGSGSDYCETVFPWRDAGYRVHVRICESERLVGGSVVTDALGLMLPGAKVPSEQDVGRTNASPSRGRLQLLEAAKAAGADNIRRLQRNLPPDIGPPARFFTPRERRAYLDRYAASNERLRAACLPESAALFSADGLDGFDADQETYSEAQLTEITNLFRSLIAMSRNEG